MSSFLIPSVIEQKLKAAGLPVSAMSFPVLADKSTWIIRWATTPTTQQAIDAQAIINNFNISTEEAKATEDQGIARAEIIYRGIARFLVAKGVGTAAEIKAAIKAEWEASN